jgi:hypothetical protein
MLTASARSANSLTQLTSPVSRRSLLRGTAAASGGLATGHVLGGMMTQGASAADARRLPLMRAVSAEKVRRGVMVQIHSSYRSSVYAQYPAVTALLTGLGVGGVRTKIAPSIPESVDYIDTLGAHGIKTYLTIGGYPVTDVQWKGMSAAIAKHAPHVLAVTGYNEPNNVRGDGALDRNWAANTVAHQKRIATFGRSLGIPVVGPALHNVVSTLPNDVIRLGELGIAAHMDRIGAHLYPLGQSPSYMLDQRAGMYRASWGNLPIDINEAGYFTDPVYSGGANPVTEREQGAYLPRMILEHASRGFRTGIFELLDDPEGGREGTLGIVAVGSTSPDTWRPKPAYNAIAGLLKALRDPRGVNHAPASIPCSVTGPADVRHMLFGRSDGTYALALWRDVNLPTEAANVSVTTRSGTQTVQVGGRYVLLPIK